ncbi:MAG: TonB-dependent receptor [Bacteroidales bacterium]|nr:TonB-dependent receptor [Bacteroidales bacterium]
MKALNLIVFLFILNLGSFAQVIKGTISDKSGQPVPGANVFLEGTYEGASSDVNGRFSFKTEMQGKQRLLVKYIGYSDYSREIDIEKEDVELNIILNENTKQLNTVEIMAGSFEAGDKKKGVVMKPLDVMTTAGGLGDVYGAMSTLPGTQMVGEEGKMFVRGGASYETQTFFDGMLVEQPYYSQMPDLPTRGRFSPWLFTGTVFSSGGYSAEYGQALSSALILESEGLAEEDVTSLSFMTVGGGASHTERWKNTSLSLQGNYTDLSPYFGLVRQKIDWDIAPRGVDGTMVFRHRTGNNGLIKAYARHEKGRSKLFYPGVDSESGQDINLKDNNTYVNTTYNGILGEKWVSKAGFSWSRDHSDFAFDLNTLDETVNALEGKYAITYLHNDAFKLKFGDAFFHKSYDQNYFDAAQNEHYLSSFTDNLNAVFLESEFSIGSNLAFRAGGRFEYSSLLKKPNLAPRLSMAFKTGKESQISLAYGDFYQTPENDFIKFAPGLHYEKATHYILNYQLSQEERTFRMEGYYKDYDELVQFRELNLADPATYSNGGSGYARGFDIFWRDNTHPYFDYWISYGYLDTERDYRDFPEKATPHFVSDHNLRTVGKYYISGLNTQVGLTYFFASGRPYEDPNKEGFMEQQTKAYHNLSLNFSYLTNIFDNFTVVHFSIDNLLGSEHVFGYRFSDQPNNNGHYKSMPIEPAAKRFIFLGVFISLTE